jgi:zinc D-Ala-D-Ala dipeptidase
MRKWQSIVAITLTALGVTSGPQTAAAQSLPGGFAYLRDIDPSIIQDIRYAGANNFMGRPLAGYGAGECVVKREVGLALKAIQQDLARQKLSLKMFDCYRPARASHDMVLGRRTDGKRRPSGAITRPSASRNCFVWAISPSVPAIPPAPRSISR